MNELAIIARLNQVLTDLIKAEIRRQDLIDTGEMLATTEALTSISGTNIAIEIFSTDYFNHVDKNFSIMDTVTRSFAWQTAIEEAVGQLFELKI